MPRHNSATKEGNQNSLSRAIYLEFQKEYRIVKYHKYKGDFINDDYN